MNYDFCSMKNLEVVESLPHFPDFNKLIASLLKVVLIGRKYTLKLDFLGQEKTFSFKYDSTYGMYVLETEKEKVNIDELSKRFKKILSTK